MNRQLPVFVISLVSSEKRRKSSTELLLSQGISFEFIDAIDGRKDRHPLLDRFRPDKFLVRHGRPSAPGEAGCYASHFLAWQKCVELNCPIIVFEDDFAVRDHIYDIFSFLPDLMSYYPFIRLEDNDPVLHKKIKQFGDYTLVRFLRIPQRATCYAISPFAAAAFIKASKEFVYPVDVFVRHQNIHKIPIYGLLPYPVYPADPSGNYSEIGNRHKDKGPLWCKLTRLFFKLKNITLNVITNIRHSLNGL
ncbi:glycosyl transferase family 25 [Desulfurispirillum indicum S5]|uniref:Glycosyl transferase family 25 n=1 Tax=Desulfurispirillum indicum (strain ATCC BAA-1389 / DSM 22839 / S5) TaxID=653733 RepID=E6W6P4_DESIS|nr:glycosyltransferase family 25 protein [Desulfurispirillum indicum]ADU65044.1 glycosyl transferase family 25 [Desulfurispirillum indicum S5]